MTRKSRKLLRKMYSEYKNRRKNKLDKQKAILFGSCEDVSQLFTELSLEDVDDCLRELEANGFIDALYGEHHIVHCSLTYEAIEHMEQLPADFLKTAFDFVIKFIPWA